PPPPATRSTNWLAPWATATVTPSPGPAAIGPKVRAPLPRAKWLHGLGGRSRAAARSPPSVHGEAAAGPGAATAVNSIAERTATAARIEAGERRSGMKVSVVPSIRAMAAHATPRERTASRSVLAYGVS